MCVLYVCVLQIVGQIRGPDGYDFTALTMVQAGLALATQRDALPAVTLFQGGGVLTPATAFGSQLVTRMNNVGVSFTVSN